MQTGNPLDLKDILHRVNIREPKQVQQIGKQQVQHVLVKLIEVSYYDCLLKIVHSYITNI